MDTNIHNGLMTKIWGPHMWFSINCIAFAYPIQPNEKQKIQYKSFFEFLGYVLPCSYCRDSYQYFITDGITKLTDDVFENRDTLTKWVFELHNRVNQKLCINYNTTYEEMCEKYELFRAKYIEHNCSMPLDLKALAFKEADKIKPVIISKNIAKMFVDYAKSRGVIMNELDIYEDIVCNKRNSIEFDKRNDICHFMITNMRYNAYPSIEINGLYAGLPTINELNLIALLCSNLSEKELIEIGNKLQYKTDKKYKLKK